MKDLLWALIGTVILVGVIFSFNKTVYGLSSGELLTGVNQVRASHNAPPLVYNQQLTNSATAKGQDMCNRDYWDHGNWISFINASGYPYLKASENLAHGFATAQATINGWINSPSHFANMIDPTLRDTGFGIVSCPGYQGKPSDIIVVEHFGVTANSAAQPQPKPKPVQKPIIEQAPTVAPEADKPKLKKDNILRDWLMSALVIQQPLYARIIK